jgi:inorganic pyrophosphatase
MRRISWISILLPVFLCLIIACFPDRTRREYIAHDATRIDRFTVAGSKNFLTDFQAIIRDQTIHVVVEIPAGTCAKWEVDKSDGLLKWEIEHEKPRIVDYLGYPGNYGMIPRTLMPKRLGGDGDPLDVLLLAPALPRGTVVKAKVIGALRLLDRGEKDDKLLAVIPDTPFWEIENVDDLHARFPGVLTIVEAWFVNYKGLGVMQSLGFVNAETAMKTVSAAVKAYEETPFIQK